MPRPFRLSALLAAASWLAVGGAQAALPRFPQPYGDRIVFVAGGSIWSVAKSGGSAQRLTSAAAGAPAPPPLLPPYPPSGMVPPQP